MKNRVTLALTLLVAAMLIPATMQAAVNGSFQRTLQVNGTVDLQVLTRSGDISVHAGPAGSVSISARIHSGSSGLLDLFSSTTGEKDVRDVEQNPPIRQTGNMIKIDYPQYRNMSIDYDITVPADTRLKAETGSGNQNLRGLKGSTTVHAGSGDLQLEDLSGPLHVDTGSGNIHGTGIGSTLEARAGSGDIRLELSGSGAVRASTGSGNVQLRGINGGLDAQTGSGDVDAEGTPASDWSIRTGSGDVTVHLPTNASYELDLSTSSGTLTVNDPVTTTVQGKVNEGGNRHHVAGKVRNGGPTLRVSTGSGDVKID